MEKNFSLDLSFGDKPSRLRLTLIMNGLLSLRLEGIVHSAQQVIQKFHVHGRHSMLSTWCILNGFLHNEALISPINRSVASSNQLKKPEGFFF